MHMRRIITLVLWLALGCTVFAEQSTDYIITNFPPVAVRADSVISVSWAGAARPDMILKDLAPDSGTLYYSKTPGGTSIAGRNKVTAATASVFNFRVAGTPAQRQIFFKPIDQPEMIAGVFYCIVAWPVTYLNPTTMHMVTDTFVSNELPLIVETTKANEILLPSDSLVSDLTPVFSWKSNPGVPYYHVLLSDEKIKIDTTGGMNVSGLSIIWQAITSSTQIVYGAPDPSGTITASPPPMSPGQTYSLVVLNNYGNQIAYSSTRFCIPKTFAIKGDTLKAPINIAPKNISTSQETIRFSWTNLDKVKANTYKVYIYVASTVSGVQAQMVVWENEVTAGSFAHSDTGFIDVNAGSVLTNNHYTWKVMAIDDRGAARAGDTTGFTFSAPSGNLEIYTKENIVSGKDTIKANVSLAEIKVEVLGGSLEKPLLFYTDNNGYLFRARPVGSYRVTAKKAGFEDVTRTVSVVDGQNTSITLFMKRPEATVYGKIVDKASPTIGIGLSKVYAASDRGDTVTAETDQFGSFVLSCYGADWRIWATKSGYIPSFSRDTTVSFGQSMNFGTIGLEKVPFTLSGTVKNSAGFAIIGANVKLIRNGVAIGEVPSTPSDGSFAFSAEAGSYTVVATKTGFSGPSTPIDLLSSRQIVLTMAPGASVVTGYIYGKSYVNGAATFAPITKASVYFKRLGATSPETTMVTSDATYGDFRVSLAGDDSFSVWSSVVGFVSSSKKMLYTQRMSTAAFYDTLISLASIKGSISIVKKTDNSFVGPANGALINILDASGKIAGSGKCQSDGTFEINGLIDGKFTVSVGAVGLVKKDIAPSETLEIIAGKATPASFAMTMIPGEKTIKWSINNGADLTSQIKVLSPLQKTVSPSDSLSNVGEGNYVVAVTPVNTSLLPLTFHQFAVGATETVHIDSITLPVTHIVSTSLNVVEDSVTLTVTTVLPLDSIKLFYRDVTNPEYGQVIVRSVISSCSLKVNPQRDGSTMEYYFIAYAGKDVYGSDKKTFRTFVNPNPKISMLEILPSGLDTLSFAANQSVSLKLQAYFSSAFIRDTTVDKDVSWSIIGDAHGASVSPAVGKNAVLKTGLGSDAVLTIVASLPVAKIAQNASPTVKFYCKVGRNPLDSIFVKRSDPKSPAPISTAAGSSAEFIALGFDSAKTAVTVTPSWTVVPAGAGIISDKGVFAPNPLFAGFARILATAGPVVAEYKKNQTDANLSGLQIQHVLSCKNSADSMSSLTGCLIVFPDSIINPDQTALFDMSTPLLLNLVQTGLDSLKVVGAAFDIKELNGVSFNVVPHDSIRITLDIPESYRAQAQKNPAFFKVGFWNEDSLIWKPLRNTKVAIDGKTISAALTHFSRYAVLAQTKGFEGSVTINPPAFSPMIRPLPNQALFGGAPQKGTCINYQVASEYPRADVKIKIYSIAGDLVWSVFQKNINPGEVKHVWWNGKTTKGDMDVVVWNGLGESAGEKLSRNGRYFVVFTIRDLKGKEKNIMKPVVLIK